MEYIVRGLKISDETQICNVLKKEKNITMCYGDIVGNKWLYEEVTSNE